MFTFFDNYSINNRGIKLNLLYLFVMILFFGNYMLGWFDMISLSAYYWTSVFDVFKN